jgi:DNA polymerase III epsilon subunit-like protein
MEQVETCPTAKTFFVFDLEFIGDVRKLSSCKIWEIAVYCVGSQQWFEEVIDPDPTMSTFLPPPIPEIPQLTREFLNQATADTWDNVFERLVGWISLQSVGTMPVFISHNTFRADKPILELECRRYGIHMPLTWYFFDSLHFSRRIIRNTNGNYSLSGLHEQIFGQIIENAHRARADVVACISIMQHLTQNTWNIQGPIYPTYSTALRTIRWIGQKAEEILFAANVKSVEELYIQLLTDARKTYQQTLFETTMLTLTRLVGNKLPPENIRNIAIQLSGAEKCIYCHVFMEPISLRCESPNPK